MGLVHKVGGIPLLLSLWPVLLLVLKPSVVRSVSNNQVSSVYFPLHHWVLPFVLSEHASHVVDGHLPHSDVVMNQVAHHDLHCPAT